MLFQVRGPNVIAIKLKSTSLVYLKHRRGLRRDLDLRYMSNQLSEFAGTLATEKDLVDLARLLRAYELNKPDPTVQSQRVVFGTSGHRGTSLNASFNENHILAITQAICLFRKKHRVDGPLFLGFDTHALSMPAFQSALEVLTANDVTVMTARDNEFTPTPVVSHAILNYNKGRTHGFADGIIITPSHNPPDQGGIKYNARHGGPAETEITNWIQDQANLLLSENLKSVKRIPYERALKCPSTHQYDFLHPYIADLANVIDIDVIRDSKIRIGVDPMGGAGVHYWQPIADFHKINLVVVNAKVDPRFSFIPRDWDGQIRMDPSSKFAMASLVERSREYDISFGCDTDHDRHGIVTRAEGLMQPNHFLTAAIYYLFKHRPNWDSNLKIGKTVVSSQMIDRVGSELGRPVFEVPVGFKWFVQGLLNSELGFAGEESAGASFLRKDGTVWTTDKDGITAGLLAAEMTAKQQEDPAETYDELTRFLGTSLYQRLESPANAEQRKIISNLSVKSITQNTLGGVAIDNVLTNAPGNGSPIGGVKIESRDGWIAIRPSGTEDINKIYGESFAGQKYLDQIIEDGHQIATQEFSPSPSR